MNKLSTWQRNNLVTGTHLATEVLASSSELKAFVVIGAYLQTMSGPKKPSKYINSEQNNLRFWLRKYEVDKHLIEIDADIVDKQLLHEIHIRDITNIEQLEDILEDYLNDFALLEPAWKVGNPLP